MTLSRPPFRPLSRPLFAAAMLGTALAGLPAAGQPQHHGASSYNPELYAAQPAPNAFVRMFPLERYGLSPHPSPVYDLRRLGAVDGPMVEQDPADPAGDSRIEAGITFLGQFVDHDITLDTTSRLDARALPGEIPNRRSADLDLDCVYGDGPEADPWLYDGPFLIVGAAIDGTGRFDLARVPGTGTALIGDPRNDENFALAQIQAAFIAFHNRMVNEILTGKMVAEGILAPGDYSDDDLKAALSAMANAMADDPGDPAAMAEAFARRAEAASLRAESFEVARDNVIHNYHRMLVEYFLPKVIGVGRTIDIATNGRRFYLPELTGPEADGARLTVQAPGVPVEFAAAAYRFGHSQVRQSYLLREGADPRDLFREAAGGQAAQNGFAPVGDDQLMDFALFFPIPGRDTAPQSTRLLDPKLPEPLFMLDRFGVVAPGDLGSLAARNLNRGRTFRLPDGEALFELVATPQIEAGLTDSGGQAVESLVSVAVQQAIGDGPGPVPFRVRLDGPQNKLVERPWIGKGPSATDACTPEALGRFTEADGEVRGVLGLPATPLWFYVLQEASDWEVSFRPSSDSHHVWPVERCLPASVDYLGASLVENAKAYGAASDDDGETFEKGQVLGPVGGTIVGEVIIGLIDHYRERTGKGLDYAATIDVDMTEFAGFGERMTFGDMIVHIGWNGAVPAN